MKKALSVLTLVGLLFVGGCFPVHYEGCTFYTQASLIGVPFPNVAKTPAPYLLTPGPTPGH